jgi:hypothetical protein
MPRMRITRRACLKGASAAAIHILAGCSPAPRCPLCGGRLVTVDGASFASDEPSKNLAVWNGSYHGVQGFRNDSPICSRCYAALREDDIRWVRATEFPETFLIPLERAILHVPMPPQEDIRYRVVYSQEFQGLPADTKCQESVAFWCATRAATEKSLQDYSAAHSLALRIEKRTPPEMWVTVEVELPSKSLERLRGG